MIITDLHSHEFRAFVEACLASPLYKKAIAEFDLPEGLDVTIDPVRISHTISEIKGQNDILLLLYNV